MSVLELEYEALMAKGDDGDVVSWLKAEMLKGLQEASIREVEGPIIFGNYDDGSPSWRIVYTATGWPLIIKRSMNDPQEHL